MPVQLPSYPIFNLLTYLLLCVIYVWPIYRKKNQLPKQHLSDGLHSTFFFFSVSLFCVFGFTNGDFFNYYPVFRKTVIDHVSGHLEEPYVWIINHCTQDYLLWRFIVWGGATMFTMLSFKRMNLKTIPAFASITLYYITTLYIMRGNLGTGMMLFGLSLILYPIKRAKYIGYFIGIAIIIASYSFHKSMLLSLALLIPAMFKIPKKLITLSFFLFPFAVGLMKLVLVYLGENGLEGADETISNSAMRYSNVAMFETNALGVLRNIINFVPICLILLLVYRSNFIRQFPYQIRLFFNYWYIWIYIACVCSFQEIGGWYFSRFMYMSQLPLAVFMAYIFQHSLNNRSLRLIIATSFISTLYTLAYAFYQLEIK